MMGLRDERMPMTQTQSTSYDGWIGQDAYDSQGEKIGEIKDVFYDDRTGRPEWVTVKTGLFKGSTFVPIHGSQIHHDPDADGEDDSLRLAFTKDMIKDAPRVDTDDAVLTPAQEQELWAFYGYDYGSNTKDFGYGSRYNERADRDFKVADDRGTVEAEATVHNQDVKVVEGTEKVRLRKYQRTEMVPVTKEEVRVERTTADGNVRTEKVRSTNR
jgi:hypothetical protein